MRKDIEIFFHRLPEMIETHQLDPKTHQLTEETHQLDPKTHQLTEETHQLELKTHQLEEYSPVILIEILDVISEGNYKYLIKYPSGGTGLSLAS